MSTPSIFRVRRVVKTSKKATYAGELDAAVTAFRGSSALLDVKHSGSATGGLDDPRQVRRGVVAKRASNVSSPGFDTPEILPRWMRREERITHGLRRR